MTTLNDILYKTLTLNAYNYYNFIISGKFKPKTTLIGIICAFGSATGSDKMTQ